MAWLIVVKMKVRGIRYRSDVRVSFGGVNPFVMVELDAMMLQGFSERYKYCWNSRPVSQ